MRNRGIDKKFHLKVINNMSGFLCFSVKGFDRLWEEVVKELVMSDPAFKGRPYKPSLSLLPMNSILRSIHGISEYEGLERAYKIRESLLAKEEWTMTPRELIILLYSEE